MRITEVLQYNHREITVGPQGDHRRTTGGSQGCHRGITGTTGGSQGDHRGITGGSWGPQGDHGDHKGSVVILQRNHRITGLHITEKQQCCMYNSKIYTCNSIIYTKKTKYTYVYSALTQQ
jgi:hypothetical protein